MPDVKGSVALIAVLVWSYTCMHLAAQYSAAYGSP